jgi:UDP-2,3-diacylglucosamine pyrophosphatase LpxH
MNHVVYVVSDLHLGPGRLPDGRWDPLEDFSADNAFSTFLDQIGRSREPVELVIAGDFLEYPQTLPELGLRSPDNQLGTTEAESLARTRVILGQNPEIASGHPDVFAALRRFMMEGHSISVIVGNHDIDLFWDSVWAAVWDAIYPPGAVGDVRRIAYSHTIGTAEHGRVHIEHGHEHDPTNRFGDRMSQPFALDQQGTRRLKRCWGTLFVDKVYNQLEQERWFIDNVKPIPRVLKLGLRHDFRFTATALGLVTRFLLTSGLPPLGGIAPLGGSPTERPATDTLINNLNDPDLRSVLETQLADPAFLAEFEASLEDLSAAEIHAIETGTAQPLTLDSASGGLGESGPLGGGAAEDAYRSEARAILEDDRLISTVIMGHTHAPIDGHIDAIDLPDGRRGLYFNSGTWTRHLKDEGRRSYTWDAIGDEQNYTTSNTYIRLTPDEHGAYHAVLGSWVDSP